MRPAVTIVSAMVAMVAMIMVVVVMMVVFLMMTALLRELVLGAALLLPTGHLEGELIRCSAWI